MSEKLLFGYVVQNIIKLSHNFLKRNLSVTGGNTDL